MKAFNVIRIVLFLTVIISVGINEYYESVNEEFEEDPSLPIVFSEKIQNAEPKRDTTSFQGL